MDAEFFEEIDVAIRLVRRRKRKALGELPRLRDLKVVQDRLQQPVELVSPAFVGAVIETLFKEVIATLKPASNEDPNDPDWRNYILLHDYFVLGEPWKVVADRLGVGRARFFEIMSSAIDTLALTFIEDYSLAAMSESAARSVQHNLPRPMYQFVRRSDDEGRDLVERVIRGLSRRPWVVSIRGFPGAGKTTLALEVAQRCVERAYFDAVIWIAARTEREGYVTSLETVFNTIGQVLGDRRIVAAESVEEKRTLVLKNLASLPKCLIIIDNTEVLTEEQHQQIYHFVQQVPMTTAVLLTSRERGRASELETVIKLFGMSVDESLAFMQNVCQARGLSPSEADLRYIYEATSGIPSAIRMAIGLMTEGYTAQEAVRSDIGQVEELLEYLLEEGYGKLTPTEKKVLHVMPILAKPAPLPIIAAASSVEGSHLRAGVNRLRTLFLINEHAASRYDILAPTRYFLRRRADEAITLLESDPGQGTLKTPYRNLARGYQQAIRALEREEQERFIRDQWDNLLSITRWCYKGEELALAGLLDLLGYWLGLWGYKRERVMWGELAVDLLRREQGGTQAAAWHLVYDVGWTHFQQGQHQQARACFEAALDMAGAGYPRVQGVALRNLAQIAREYHRNFDEAKRLYLDALSIFQQIGDERWIAICKGGLGVLALLQHDAGQAEQYLADAQEINQQLGEIEGLVSNISDRAQVALENDNLPRAEHLLSRSSQLAQERELPEEEAYAKVRLARLRERQGRIEEAFALAQQAHQIYERVGLRTPTVGEVEQLRNRLQMRAQELNGG